MTIEIYSSEGLRRAQVQPSQTDRCTLGIMEVGTITLSFVLPGHVNFLLGDYVDFLGERYQLMADYTPDMRSECEYHYNLKLQNYVATLERAIVLKPADIQTELGFSYYATAREHLQLVVDNINRTLPAAKWSVGSVASTKNINIDYANKSCLSALSEISSKFEVEWWVEGRTINLSRCEHGEPVTLGYASGLTSLRPIENASKMPITRLYPLGSVRNIDRGSYGSSRLKMPNGLACVERNTHLGIIERAEEKAFSDVYPRYTGTITSVRMEQRKSSEGKSFQVYYISDDKIPFNPNDHELPGLVKHVVFQSGELNGHDFEANYHAQKKEWELITQYPTADTQLPQPPLVPKKGDVYIPYNFRMPEEYIRRAEKELEQKAREYLEKISQDTIVYKCQTDYVEMMSRGDVLSVGRRVSLLDDHLFARTDGRHSSRITRISRKLTNPYEAEIDCSYAVDFGRLSKIEGHVAQLDALLKDTQATLPTILKSWDSGDLSEYNVLSALRTIHTIRQIALRKDADDYTAHNLGSRDYVPGLGGWLIDKLGNASFSNLKVFGTLEVDELRRNRITIVEGEHYFSSGTAVVAEVGDGSLVPALEDGDSTSLVVGDYCIGKWMVAPGQVEVCRLKVARIDADGRIHYSLAPGSPHPRVGMHLAQMGHESDPRRQRATCVRNNVIIQYAGVQGWEVQPQHITALMGDLEGYNQPPFGRLTGSGVYLSNAYITGTLSVRSADGSTQRVPYERGDWTQGTVAQPYDLYTYRGRYWLWEGLGATKTAPSLESGWSDKGPSRQGLEAEAQEAERKAKEHAERKAQEAERRAKEEARVESSRRMRERISIERDRLHEVYRKTRMDQRIPREVGLSLEQRWITASGSHASLYRALTEAMARPTEAAMRQVEQLQEAYKTSVVDLQRGIQEAEAAIREAIFREARGVSSARLDALALDPNKWYPITIELAATPVVAREERQFGLRLTRGLFEGQGTPQEWWGHKDGYHFSLHWSVQPAGWGQRREDRRVYAYIRHYLREGTPVVSSPKQITEGSVEYVYVRGGSLYELSVVGLSGLSIQIHPEGYEWRTSPGDDTYLRRLPVLESIASIGEPRMELDILSDRLLAEIARERGELQRAIQAAQSSSSAALEARVQGVLAQVSQLEGLMRDGQAVLQRQIDRQVERWYGSEIAQSGVPPTSLWPASDNAKHEGDTYTCVAPKGVTITASNAHEYPNVGKSWRWTNGGSGTAYGWELIADTDITQALALASRAQATADGKMTHYITPTPPVAYQQGDQWTLPAPWQGRKGGKAHTYPEGTILTATADSLPGQHHPEHWVELVRYTDDSKIDALKVGTRNLVLSSRAEVSYTDRPTSPGWLYRRWQLSTLRPSSKREYCLGAWVEVTQGRTDSISAILYDTASGSGRWTHNEIRASYDYTQGGRQWLTWSFPPYLSWSDGERLANQLLIYAGRAGHTQGIGITISELCLVEGNMPPPAWTPAPEDVEAEIERKARELSTQLEAARRAIATAQAAAEAAKRQADKGVSDAQANDGKIDEAEARGIARAVETYRRALSTEWEGLVSAYKARQASPYLMDKQPLSAAYNTAKQRHDSLTGRIESILADSKVSEQEYSLYAAAYEAYQVAARSLTEALEAAALAMQERLKQLSSEATALAEGRAKEHADSRIDALKVGTRNLVLSSGEPKTSNVYRLGSWQLSEPWQAGETYTYALWMRHDSDQAQRIDIYPNDGSSRLDQVMVPPSPHIQLITLTAVLPPDRIKPSRPRELRLYTMSNHPNRGGSVSCALEHIAVVRGNMPPQSWTPAPEDVAAEIERKSQELSRQLEAARRDIATAQAAAEAAKRQADKGVADAQANDGKIDEAEARAIARAVEAYRRALIIEWEGLLSAYTSRLASPYLVDKQPLSQAYQAAAAKYTALKQRADAILADGKVSAAEYSQYTTAYEAYQPASRSLSQALEAAAKAIQERLKQLSAEAAAEAEERAKGHADAKVGGLKVGTRNLILQGQPQATLTGKTDKYLSRSYKFGGVSVSSDKAYCLGAWVEVLEGRPKGIAAATYRYKPAKWVHYKTATYDLERGGRQWLTWVMPAAAQGADLADTLLIYAGVAGETQGVTITVSEVTLVEGNMPPQSWTPAPEDVAAELERKSQELSRQLETARTAIATAQAAAEAAKRQADKGVADAQANDGKIDEAEARAIARAVEAYRRALIVEWERTLSTYTALITSAYLPAKGLLSSAYSTAKQRYDALKQRADAILADGKVSAAEYSQYTAAYEAYQAAARSLAQALEDATGQVQQELLKRADEAAGGRVDAISLGGRNLYVGSLSPVLRPNNTGLGTTSTLNEGDLRYSRITPDASKAISVYSPIIPELVEAGVIYSMSVYIRHQHTAPVDVGLKTASGHTRTTIPPGKWVLWREEGVRPIPSGRISIKVYAPAGLAIDLRQLMVERGNKATDWRPAPEDIQQELDSLGGQLATAQQAIATAQAAAEAAKRQADKGVADAQANDGKIDEAEARAIARAVEAYRRALIIEWEGLVSAYTSRLASPYLMDKQPLSQAYQAAAAKYTALKQRADAILADGKVSAAEYSQYTAAYEAYQPAARSLAQALEAAAKAIQDRLRQLSSDAAASAESRAKGHADTKASEAEGRAKGHADTKAREAEGRAKGHADTQASEAERRAKEHAERKAQEAESRAKEQARIEGSRQLREQVSIERDRLHEVYRKIRLDRRLPQEIGARLGQLWITASGAHDSLYRACTETIARPTEAAMRQVEQLLVAYKTGVVDLQRGLQEAEEAIREGIYNQARGKTRVRVEGKGLDPNKYYPIIIKPRPNPAYPVYGVRLERGLYQRELGVPPYASHSYGFDLRLEWSFVASGWGAAAEDRKIYAYSVRHVRASEPPLVSRPKQEMRASWEYVYVRGGSDYYVEVTGATDLDIQLYPEGAYWEGSTGSQYSYRWEVLESIDALGEPKVDLDVLSDRLLAEIARERGELQRAIQAAQSSSSAALEARVQGVLAQVSQLEGLMRDGQAVLQRQIDRQVERWYGSEIAQSGVPPTSLWPASDNAKHEGDTYTCVAPRGVTITPDNAQRYPNVGRSWRWTNGGSGTTYGWELIADTDITQALALASRAQATADGKMTHYITPTPPVAYQQGDQWTLPAPWQGRKGGKAHTYPEGTILTATADSLPGQHHPEHWVELVRYTDDSKVDALRVSTRNLIQGGKTSRTITAAASTYALTEYGVGEHLITSAKSYCLGAWVEVTQGSTAEIHAGLYRRDPNQWSHPHKPAPYDTAKGGRQWLTWQLEPAIGAEITGSRPLIYAGRPGQTKGNTVVIGEAILVEGNMPPQAWLPAPEEIEAELHGLGEQLTEARRAITEAQQAAQEAKRQADRGVSAAQANDGKIDEAEARAIARAVETYRRALSTEWQGIVSACTTRLSSPYLVDKQPLSAAYNTAKGKLDQLTSRIATILADGKVSASEYSLYSSAYEAYQGAAQALTTTLEAADRAIQDRLKQLATDEARGAREHADAKAREAEQRAKEHADAKVGGIKVGTRNLLLTSGTSKTSSLYLLSAWTLSEDWVVGETYTLTLWVRHQSPQEQIVWLYPNNGASSAGRIVIPPSGLHRISITLTMTTHVYRPNAARELRLYVDGNHPNKGERVQHTVERICLTRGNMPAQSWIPAPEDTQAEIDLVEAALLAARNEITKAQAAADAAKTQAQQANAAALAGDGKIDEAEARAIARAVEAYRRALLVEWEGLLSAYTSRLASPYLIDKQPLNQAYQAAAPKYTALKQRADAILADGKVSAAEYNQYTAAYEAYQPAARSLAQALEAAAKAMQDRLKQLATEAASAAEGRAKGHADGKAREAEDRAKGHADSKASEAERRAKQHADTKASEAEERAKQHAQQEVARLDYLKAALQEGSAGIEGGVVLGQYIAVKDLEGIIRGYLSGLMGNVFLAAGVEGHGTAQETRNVEISHDGDGHFGQLHFRGSGQEGRVDFVRRGESAPYLSVGGSLAPIEEVIRDAHLSDTYTSTQTNMDYYPLPLQGATTELKVFEVARNGASCRVSGQLQAPFLRFDGAGAGHDYWVTIDTEVILQRWTTSWEDVAMMDRVWVSGQSNTETASGQGKMMDCLIPNLPKGRYRLLGRSRYTTNYYQLQVISQIRIMPLTILVERVSSVQQVAFTEGGFRAFYGADRFLDIAAQGPHVLSARGATDIPGVLAAGRVDAQGQITSSWGARVKERGGSRARAYRDTSNVYTVYHSIGHDRYTVQLTVQNSWNVASYSDITPWSFKVRLSYPGGSWGNAYAGEFSYLCIGDNGAAQ